MVAEKDFASAANLGFVECSFPGEGVRTREASACEVGNGFAEEAEDGAWKEVIEKRKVAPRGWCDGDRSESLF